MKKVLFIFSLIAITLTACGLPKNFIIPINKSIVGNLHVVDISVITDSKPLAHQLKDAVLEETIKRLKGTHDVKLKIKVTQWVPAYDFNGVKTGNKRTSLGITVTVLDAKTNAIIGKYSTSSFQGNDLPVTPSGQNTNTRVIGSVAYFTAWQLEK